MSNTNFQSFSVSGFTFGAKAIYFKNEGKVYSAIAKTIIELPDEKDETVSYYGIKQNVTVNLQEPFDKVLVVKDVINNRVSFPIPKNVEKVEIKSK